MKIIQSMISILGFPVFVTRSIAGSISNVIQHGLENKFQCVCIKGLILIAAVFSSGSVVYRTLGEKTAFEIVSD